MRRPYGERKESFAQPFRIRTRHTRLLLGRGCGVRQARDIPGANIYLSGTVPTDTVVSAHGAHLLMQATEECIRQRPLWLRPTSPRPFSLVYCASRRAHPVSR